MAAIPNISPVCMNNEAKTAKEARKDRKERREKVKRKKVETLPIKLAYSTWEY